jgi:hypothetical protein
MSGYQFGHIATYSRKGNSNHRSVFEICAEADRLPGHHPHVEIPLEPTLLGGVFRPAQVPAEIERRVAEAKGLLKGKTKATRQVIRSDTHVLEAQVYSHPIYTRPAPADHDGEDRPCISNPEDREAYLAWRELTVAFAFEEARRRNLEVLSIVEHVDEEHPHVHVLCVPLNPQLNAKLSHPGHVASVRRQKQAKERGVSPAKSSSPEEALAEPKPVKPGDRNGKRRGSDIGRRTPVPRSGGRKKKKKGEELTEKQLLKQIGDRAYRAAMRQWQTLYYEEVGIDSGLTRHGPRRLRWSREQWRHSKTDAEAVAKLNKRRLENEQRAAAAEERRDKALKDAAEFEASVQPGSKLHDKLRSIVDLAHDDRSAVLGEIGGLQQDLERARRTIADADHADLRLAAARSEEEELQRRLAALAEQERAAAARLRDAEGHLAAAEDAERRQLEAEEKATKAEERASAATASADAAESRTAEIELTQANLDQRERGLVERDRELSSALAKAKAANDAADRRVEEADRSAAVAEARLTGVEAWLSGDLIVKAGVITFSEKVSEAERATILSAGEWMREAATQLGERLEARVIELGRTMRDVVTATVEAWSSGLLVGTTPRVNGAPILDLAGEEEAKTDFLATVRGWATLVARVFQRLPDLPALRQVERRAEALQSNLDIAEQRAADDFAARLAQFVHTKGKGVSGP